MDKRLVLALGVSSIWGSVESVYALGQKDLTEKFRTEEVRRYAPIKQSHSSKKDRPGHSSLRALKETRIDRKKLILSLRYSKKQSLSSIIERQKKVRLAPNRNQRLSLRMERIDKRRTFFGQRLERQDALLQAKKSRLIERTPATLNHQNLQEKITVPVLAKPVVTNESLEIVRPVISMPLRLEKVKIEEQRVPPIQKISSPVEVFQAKENEENKLKNSSILNEDKTSRDNLEKDPQIESLAKRISELGGVTFELSKVIYNEKCNNIEEEKNKFNEAFDEVKKIEKTLSFLKSTPSVVETEEFMALRNSLEDSFKIEKNWLIAAHEKLRKLEENGKLTWSPASSLTPTESSLLESQNELKVDSFSRTTELVTLKSSKNKLPISKPLITDSQDSVPLPSVFGFLQVALGSLLNRNDLNSSELIKERSYIKIHSEQVKTRLLKLENPKLNPPSSANKNFTADNFFLDMFELQSQIKEFVKRPMDSFKEDELQGVKTATSILTRGINEFIEKLEGMSNKKAQSIKKVENALLEGFVDLGPSSPETASPETALRSGWEWMDDESKDN